MGLIVISLFNSLNMAPLPVLPWAPGKWFGARGRVIRKLMEQAAAGSFLAGDTTMRPTGWPVPVLLRYARRSGLGTVAGSDPLPQPGEEAYAGTYGIFSDVTLDPTRPADGLRNILLRGNTFTVRGRRCGPLEMAQRWNRHRKSKTQ